MSDFIWHPEDHEWSALTSHPAVSEAAARMKAAAPVSFSADADGVGWIMFDNPAARANVLNAAAQRALEGALDEAAAQRRLKALVITSGKERIFIAGADLAELTALPDAAAATEFSRRGQRLLQRIADWPVPVVAAIHGACAGGGFELALACHWRIASDGPVTQIGLPETSIGTIPGWGGSVRLPRLIGVKPALDHIVRGQLVSAAAALEGGMVHEVVQPDALRTRAKVAARKLAIEGHPVHPPHPAVPREVLAEIRAGVMSGGGRNNPALPAAVDAVEKAAALPMAKALDVEARIFGEITAGDVCKNLIRVFRLREAAKKRTLEGWFESGAGLRPAPAIGATERAGQRPALPPIRRVGVVGAGVMGSGIAQWLAARGFDVVMRDVDPGALERGLATVRVLFDQAVARGKLTGGAANSALQRLSTTTAWEGFETCDLVLEAIVENVAAKQALFHELASVVRPDALLASNTSALPIEEISPGVARPERTLGIHFFNPVSRMTLVELVLRAETAPAAAERALELLKALGKSPVICRSSPGFLVTRVLFFYLNTAVRLWEQGAATTELDAAMQEFGWPMGPLRLIDEVGLDVTNAIFREMEHYYPQRFTRATTCERLVAAGLAGRKNGASRGFYRYDGARQAENDAETRPLAGARGYTARADERRGEVVECLMRIMVGEARRCLDEGVVKTEADVDFALLSGAGFPAFRGGLLRWARSVGG